MSEVAGVRTDSCNKLLNLKLNQSKLLVQKLKYQKLMWSNPSVSGSGSNCDLFTIVCRFFSPLFTSESVYLMLLFK